MSSSDFAHIANRTERGKADRLFRAAVIAFCALTRPTKREIAQLEDLVLPLFDAVSAASRRFVAACLSETHEAPAALIRRLADEPIEISAPLIVRSPQLADIDLVALIGRRGLPHAKAIGRRAGLNPAIANLILALEKQSPEDNQNGDEAMPQFATAESARTRPSASMSADADNAMTPAEIVRSQLREMMVPSEAASRPTWRPFEHVPRGALFKKLRTTALTGIPAYFQTALADALGVEFGLAKAMTESDSYCELTFALKALDLDAEEAFVLVATAFPKHFKHPEGIRLFVEGYETCSAEKAHDRLRGWRADTLAISMDDARQSLSKRGSNTNDPAPPKTALKAS